MKPTSLLALAAFLSGLGFTGAAFAQSSDASDEMIFRPEKVDQCLAGRQGSARLDCAGLAAEDCQQVNEGGGTTIGLGMCFTAESDWWDAKLNQAYQQLSALEAEEDLDAKESTLPVPERVPALKDMQRKWIAYRDALCEYEYVQWGGGTGGGPASAQCALIETARQYFVLADRLADR
ncbi:MAG: DUF1311 domain-containing protein [Nitratireductor sp.]|nr:DUF1311 domain-containing protein [Nitratireductor sp.]